MPTRSRAKSRTHALLDRLQPVMPAAAAFGPQPDFAEWQNPHVHNHQQLRKRNTIETQQRSHGFATGIMNVCGSASKTFAPSNLASRRAHELLLAFRPPIRAPPTLPRPETRRCDGCAYSPGFPNPTMRYKPPCRIRTKQRRGVTFSLAFFRRRSLGGAAALAGAALSPAFPSASRLPRPLPSSL